jgi:hypothetical protein
MFWRTRVGDQQASRSRKKLSAVQAPGACLHLKTDARKNLYGKVYTRLPGFILKYLSADTACSQTGSSQNIPGIIVPFPRGLALPKVLLKFSQYPRSLRCLVTQSSMACSRSGAIFCSRCFWHSSISCNASSLVISSAATDPLSDIVTTINKARQFDCFIRFPALCVGYV